MLICFTHTLSHSGGGSKNHVFLPLTIACQEGRSTLSIYEKKPDWQIIVQNKKLLHGLISNVSRVYDWLY